ncbi:hypothetical protein AMAG_08617 [Allomyces macrogynus ATCC 38327]|uniref:Uncharacterized protein n=1 Tax=Allomyces macrogynus (strain ATCC 38327) TaxID=578462 RepID=A0A0L0SMA4_ALLM3|nr:hypothetical protein AMAG_08617 [Allomyces macrogynus ATCC 38327]|eukprot:KNE63495.1 hypothetical protein AMAG_08617 [Allomyces macrogynus ATCC 38327]
MANAAVLGTLQYHGAHGRVADKPVANVLDNLSAPSSDPAPDQADTLVLDASSPPRPPPLLYDLIRVHEWAPDPAAAATPATPAPWLPVWCPSTASVAVLADDSIELVRVWDHAQDATVAATPQPEPWVAPEASPFRHAPLDRRGAWSPDGHVLAVALATGTVLLFADVGSTIVQVLELRPAKTAPSADPLVFVHVARAADDSRAPYHALTVSRAGHVRLVAVDVPARVLAIVGNKSPVWSPDGATSCLPDGMTVSLVAQWDAAPYLAGVHDAAWHAQAHTLYLTGKLHDDDQSTRAPVPLLALRLVLDDGGFDLHPDAPLPTAPRTAGQIWLLRAVSSLATGLAGRSAPPAQSGSENSREGLQLSLWSPPSDTATLEDARILLRDSHGHLRIVDGHGTHIDRYDAGFLKLVHHGHPVAHAAWWDRPTAPSADDDNDELSRTCGPSIVTTSTAGLVMVHSFPEWTPVSDAEQFNVPVLLSHVAGGRSCLLDCELTWPRTALATRPPLPQRSLVTRALRSVTNTFLWHFDDDDETQATQQGPAGPNRMWTLWDWRPLTAAEMLVRKLTVDRDYQGALDMARAHGMTTDVVYQTQWLHLQEREQQPDDQAVITPESVTTILGQVTDTIWVLRACAETVPRDPTAARALLVHGLQLTESTADAVRRAAAESAIEPDLAVLVEFRLTLLRLLDRLELFTRIHLPSATDRHLHHPAYIRLRTQNLVHVAIEYARAGHVAAVGTLLAVLTPLSAFRLHLCAELPAFLDPDLYASLLPGYSATPDTAKVHHWRSPDWCEAADITRWVGWTHDWDSAAALRDPPAAPLADWFAARARRIEAETGCADTALRVLDLAVERGVAGVEELRFTMRQFAWLVYACGTAEWSAFSLAEFESVAPEHVLRRVVDRAVAVVGAAEEVAENAWLQACIDEFLVPFVDARCAHVALLTVLAPLFEARPQLVLAVLAADDIWWGNNGLAAKDGGEEKDDLDVQFTHKVLGMAYAVAAVDDAWIDHLGQLFEQLPNLNDDDDDDEEVPPPTPTPKLHRRLAAWRAIQTFEAHITAAETFAHVGLYLSPRALDAISRGTAVAEPRDQHALLRELFRRASATTPATVEWVFDAIHDLLELRFFHMPKEDVYAAALRYALGGMNAKYAVMAADLVGRGPVVTKAVAEVAGEMADRGRFGDAVECLSLIPFVNVDADLARFSALKLLHANRVPHLSRHLARGELLARAVTADVPRGVLVAAGRHLGYSPIEVACVLLQHAPVSRAAAALADSLIRQVATSIDPIEPATLAFVCRTLMDAARRVPDQAASLVRFCVDHAPADQLPAVLDRWREMQRDTHPSPAAAHDADIVEKRVAPIYVDASRATRADMDAWLATPPITPAATPEAQFRTARSLHAALAVVPQCDPARIDAQCHALVLYAVGKQALRDAVPDVSATDIVDSGMAVADELAVLAGRVPDHAVAIAREMEALEQQAVRYRLAQVPNVDVERFLGSREYQGRVVGELMRDGEWELVQVLAEHVQLGSAELVAVWVRANAEVPEMAHDRPRAVVTWVGKVKEGGVEKVAEVVKEMAKVLELDSTTVHGHALVYDLYAQLCPAHADQCRVRQKVITTFLPLQLPGWSTPAAIHRYLAGSMEYFRAFFQLAVTSQITYTSLRDAIASLQDLAVLPDLDHVAAGSTPVRLRQLVSCLTAVRVHAVVKEDAPLATPLPRSRAATGHGSPTQAEGSPRLRSFFGLGSPTLPFASLQSTTTPAPTDPLLQIVTLLRDVDPSDLALFHDDLVAHLCRRLTVTRLDTVESVVRAMDAAFPARQSDWSFLWRAAGTLRSVQAMGVRACSFMDHVTTDPPTLAVQQLLLQGVAVASIESTYTDLATVYTAATPYVAPRAADARPPPSPFAAALEASLCTILMSGSDVAPLVAAMTRAPAPATRLFMHVVAEVAPQLAAPLADMLDDAELKCQVLAAAALTGIGTAAFDLDLDAIHERWVAQCAQARSPGPHEERVACVCAWHTVTEVPVSVWVREVVWVQSVPVSWVVAFRAQLGELSLETEEALLAQLVSTPHRVAFCLASTHPEILHYGISLLTPLPRDEDDSDNGNDTNEINLTPFAAVLPLIRARRDLAPLAERWPTWNLHVPSAPLVTEHLQLHPLLLAQALVGQIRLDRRSRPPRPAWSGLRLQMSDGDLWALVESRYA